MKSPFFFAVALAASVAGAQPAVSNVSLAEDAATGELTVTYDLANEDAIVTVDFLTNGVSVLTADDRDYVRGDAFRLVGVGSGRAFTWRPIEPLKFRAGTLTAQVTAWTKSDPPDYLVVDLTMKGLRRYYEKIEDLPGGGVTSVLYKTDRFVFRKIPAKDIVWRMGEPVGGETNDGTSNNTISQRNMTNEFGHMVKLTSDYYIGIYETTRRQMQRMINHNSWGATAYTNHTDSFSTLSETLDAWCLPADCAKLSYDVLRGAESDTFKSWPESGHAVAASSKIQAIRTFTGLSGIDLPTEAQWEYACRAGTGTQLNHGKNLIKTSRTYDSNLSQVAWYGRTNGTAGGDYVHPVGFKRANAWGLYDMHGNLAEVCLDRPATYDAYPATFASDWATGGVTVDPVGTSDTSVTNIIGRGGDYFYYNSFCRSASRELHYTTPRRTGNQHFGIRLVCNLPVEE